MSSAFSLPPDATFALPSSPTIAPMHPLTAFADMLAAAEATSSKKDKQAIVKAALIGPHGAQILKLLTYALSPYIRFGIKQLPEPDTSSLVAANAYDLVCTTLDALAARRVTGNAAQAAVKMLLETLSDTGTPVSEREAVRRVLAKDLRAGFDTSTVNKAQKGAIEVFDCQLAEDASRAGLDTLTYPLVAEPKYDGVRVIAIKKDGIVALLSRNGIPFENFQEVEEHLVSYMPDNHVLDGEILHQTLLGEEGYKAVMKRAKASRGKNVEGNPIRYQVFDGMALSQWAAQDCPAPFEQRRKALELVVDWMGAAGACPLFNIAPSDPCATAAELETLYRGYVAEGFEGIIAKNPAALYAFKRNASWLKIKPFKSADLEVVGIVEGNGKYAGMMGTLEVAGTHDGKLVKCEVGTGFSDAQRKAFWDAWSTGGDGDAKGRVMEIRFQDMTQAEGSATWALRFPSFMRFREVDAAGKV